MIEIGPTRCGGCGELHGEGAYLPDPDQRAPCPRCGSKARQYGVRAGAETAPLFSLNAEGRSRGKGWFRRILIRAVPQHSRDGAIAQHERTMDRDADQYTGTVTMRDTGEVARSRESRADPVVSNCQSRRGMIVKMNSLASSSSAGGVGSGNFIGSGACR